MKLNQQAFDQSRVLRFGRESSPILVIDGAFENFEALRHHARVASYSRIGPHFPGLRTPAAPAYQAALLPALAPLVRDYLDLEVDALVGDSLYSIVSQKSGTLSVVQRLPHFDGLEPFRLACMHYLSGPEFGGTRFFRQKATGFEFVDPSRLTAYESELRRGVVAHGVPNPRYTSDGGPLFELIGEIEAEENRLIVYRGNALHSGHITKPEALSEDPGIARLSINSFLRPA